MAARPLILIPPSEGKSAGGDGAAWQPDQGRFAALADQRDAVATALVKAMRASGTKRQKLLGVGGEALATATETNRAVRDSASRPAIERYTGVLYGALDPATMPKRSRSRAAEQLVVFSGLWGLAGPDDPIPDYKLKMGAALASTGKLSTWWRPHLTRALAEVSAGRTVWDLLPNEHAAAWAPDPADVGPRVRVKFLDRTVTGEGERLVAVSHWNKLLKGALIRHVLAHQLDDPAGLEAFDHPLGYHYDPTRTSTDDEGVTTVSMVRTA